LDFIKTIIRPISNRNNFRPISNLMFMSKLIEKVVASQLIHCISSNGLHEILQSAYEQFHSTETALVKVFNDIVLDVDRNTTVILLLLDLSAAFDAVDNTILIDRLANRLGLCDLALAWFKSYLSDRTHSVSIRGARSVTRSLSCGVPQGSVLGPILCLLYTSPLRDIVRQYNMGYHSTLSCTCLSILSVGMIKLMLSRRLNPVSTYSPI